MAGCVVWTCWSHRGVGFPSSHAPHTHAILSHTHTDPQTHIDSTTNSWSPKGRGQELRERENERSSDKNTIDSLQHKLCFHEIK